MSKKNQIFEKYKKSDIFSLTKNDEALHSELKSMRQNHQPSFINTQEDIFHTLEPQKTSNKDKPVLKRTNMLRHYKSDIFNLKNIIKTPKKPTLTKNRNASNLSNFFEGMQNNEEYKIDIKEYTNKHRKQKKVYDPNKYFIEEDPSDRVYNNLYDNKRNPIFPNQHLKNIKSSSNLLSNVNDKKLFTERKKVMRKQFTEQLLTHENATERKRLEEENQKGLKNHKFYKTKGFTYNDNNYRTENNFYHPTQNHDNISKINKQIDLQSKIFGENNKNADLNKIKERIKTARIRNEDREKKVDKKELKNKNIEREDNDRNIWGALHSNWEKSNLDWKNSNTELLFGKTYSGPSYKIKLEKNKEKEKEDAFTRKVKHLSDSGFKDTINEQESIKSKRNWNKVPLTHRPTYSNLEQIDEVLNEISDKVLRPDRKKKIIGNANTTNFNGEIGIDDKYINYQKYHKQIWNENKNKNKKKTPIIKIMSNEDNKNISRKVLNKTVTDFKLFDDYKVHDYVLSYDTKIKSSKENLDSFSDNDVKLIFSKKGIHIYDIKRNCFDNGKYNTIKFKVRDNEGDDILKEKIKNVETEFNKKQYKVDIKKDVEKNKKVDFRKIAKNPFKKGLIITEENKNIKETQQKTKTLKKNSSFSGAYTLVNHKYKKLTQK